MTSPPPAPNGTPAQVRSLIKDDENGLFSRFMFYYLNAKSEWHDVFDAGNGMALDEYFRQLGEQFYSQYKLLQPLLRLRRFPRTPASTFVKSVQAGVHPPLYPNSGRVIPSVR